MLSQVSARIPTQSLDLVVLATKSPSNLIVAVLMRRISDYWIRTSNLLSDDPIHIVINKFIRYA